MMMELLLFDQIMIYYFHSAAVHDPANHPSINQRLPLPLPALLSCRMVQRKDYKQLFQAHSERASGGGGAFFHSIKNENKVT